MLLGLNQALKYIKDDFGQLEAETRRIEGNEFSRDLTGSDKMKILWVASELAMEGADLIVSCMDAENRLLDNVKDPQGWLTLADTCDVLLHKVEEIQICGRQLDLGDSMTLRNSSMHTAAMVRSNEKGVWKIGDDHAKQIQGKNNAGYNLLTRDEFYKEPVYSDSLKPLV